jgi:hypothetical protein
VKTGFPNSDAAAAFARTRRRQSLTTLATRLTRKDDDTLALLRFDDVVGSLGPVAGHDVGLQQIAVDSIVGTVDRSGGEFDRLFRPRSARLRSRWQRIAAARGRGTTLPPIDVYRIGEVHFVQDGHHRVSVARALGDATIDARVRNLQAVGQQSSTFSVATTSRVRWPRRNRLIPISSTNGEMRVTTRNRRHDAHNRTRDLTTGPDRS